MGRKFQEVWVGKFLEMYDRVDQEIDEKKKGYEGGGGVVFVSECMT